MLRRSDPLAGRWLTIASCFLLMMGGGFLGHREVAGAAADFDAFQHNIEYNEWGAIEYVSRQADRPLVIAGQEFCEDEFEDATQSLMLRGYSVVAFQPWANAQTTKCGYRDCDPICDGGYGFKVIVASLGYYANASGHWVANEFTNQAPGDRQRGYACIRASYGYEWWACSAHMSGPSPSYANLQTGEYRNIGMFLGGIPITMSGDFNREHDEPVVLAWNQSWWESDPSSNPVRTFENDKTSPYDQPQKKLDYIFGLKLRTERRADPFVGCNAYYVNWQTSSDHCFVRGKFRFVP